MKAEPDYTVTEHELSEKLGVSRNAIKKIRRDALDPGQDYSLVGGKITLTSEAVAVVMGRLGVDPDEDIADDEKTPPEPSIVIACVCRIWPINRRIMDARLEDKTIIRIRVRDNMMFVIGQEIPVKKDVNDIYYLACRNPVKKGRVPWKRNQ